MSKQGCKAFRLSFVRRKINTLCRSRALRAALLAELHGGPDAALVVQMVERASPIVRPPTQMVAPMPQQNEDEGYNTSPEVDFDVFHFWALGLNSFLWRIDLYKEGQGGFWTL